MTIQSQSRVDLSVIIPTYNRKDSLLRTLESLSRQTYPADRFEVIIVDDGGSDGTADALSQAAYPFHHRYVVQSHCGVGAARQLGLREAVAPLVLFLDDDMVCEPQVITEHVAVQAANEHAVVKGQVILILDDEMSVYARVHSGARDLPLAQDAGPQEISYQQVFAGHFSIHREDALAAGGWIEELRGYGFEDLEFMYRCKCSGLRMLFAPAAVSYHYDYATTLAQACRRAEHASISAATCLLVQHPAILSEMPMYRDKMPIRWRQDSPPLIARKTARQIMSSRPVMWVLEQAVPLLERRASSSKALALLYRWIISGHIFRGYRKGLTETRRQPLHPLGERP